MSLSSYEPTKKNSMSWIDIKVWLNEQRNNILRSYIDNVFYIEKALIMRIKNSIKNLDSWLIIEPGKRINFLSTGIKPVTEEDPKTSLWRKNLRDCRIDEIEQYDNERIILIHLFCRSSRAKTIVVELLPRGVIAILDESKRILLASEYRKMRDRIIKLGMEYVFPPSRTLYPLDKDLIDKFIKNASIGIIIKELGLPAEIVNSAAIECSIIEKQLIDRAEIECLFSSINKLISTILNQPTPCIVYKDTTAIGFYPFIPPFFNTSNYNVVITSSFNEAVERYFLQQTEELLTKRTINEIAKEIAKLRKSIEDIDQKITYFEKNLKDLKLRLQCYEEHYTELERIHECVINIIKEIGWNYVRRCGDIVHFQPSTGTYTISINGCNINLNVRYPLIYQYNELRKNISDIEKSIERALEEKIKLKQKIDELSNRVLEEKQRVKIKLSLKKEWYEKYHWTITPASFLVIGGRDASQNIQLIKKFLEPNDIVLHADIHGASTVIIKTNGRNVDEETLMEAAIIAACYSKAWKSGLLSIDVFWVYGSQISLSPPTGEYLPKGSYMIYGKKNYIKNIPLKLALGIAIDENKNMKIVIGSENLVSRKSIAYMVIVPGDETPEKVVNMFLEYVKKNLNMDFPFVIRDEIIKEIPGKSKVIKLVTKDNNNGDVNA